MKSLSRAWSARSSAVLGLGVLMTLLAACGGTATSSSDADETSASTADEALVALLPEDVKAKGKLVVATDPNYPPNEFTDEDGKTIVGMDVDLAKAIGAKLGLRLELASSGFDGIIPGLHSGKYDLGMSSMTDTKAREEVVDFVTYFQAGTSFFVREGGPDIATLEDLCGQQVAVLVASSQQADAEAQAEKCAADGKPGVTVTVLTGTGPYQALASDRADVVMTDSPVAAYQVKTSNGQFELRGESYGLAPYGIAMTKDSGLAEAVHGAMQALIESGEYLEILETWGVEGGAIDEAVVNGAIS